MGRSASRSLGPLPSGTYGALAGAGTWTGINHFNHATPGPTDVWSTRVSRSSTYTGGTAGFVNSALRVETTVGSGVSDFEWGILSKLVNNSTTGENVAVYGQANRTVDGKTWAGVFENRDATSVANPATGQIGCEISVFANGTDTVGRRIGVDVVTGKGDVAGVKSENLAGIRVGPFNSDTTQGIWNAGILVQGSNLQGLKITSAANVAIALDGTSSVVGINFANGTHTTAIRFARGQKITWEATDTIDTRLAPAANIVQFMKSGAEKVGLDTDTPGLRIAATQVVGIRVTGYTAMTGTPDKATAYATSTVTLPQLAGRVAQLQADLTAHGLIGT